MLSYLEKQQDLSRTDRSVHEVSNPTRRRRARIHLTEEELADLATRYRAGETVYELADRFGIHRQTVSTLLERSGVGRHYRVLDATAVGRAAELYRSGWSLKRVATEFGVTAETVRQAFLNHGVPTRPRPGWSVD